MEGIIYCYTSPSGKKYIGQTIDETKRKSRFRNLKYHYGGGKKIENARKKYGPENFVYEVVKKYSSESKKMLHSILNRMEKYYIKKFNTFKCGYNSTPGGNFYYGKERRTQHIGNSPSEETRKKISEGIKKFWKGKRRTKTPEQIQKISDKNSKQVFQFDLYKKLVKTWKNSEEIYKNLGFDPSGIRKAVKYKKIKYGFIWSDSLCVSPDIKINIDYWSRKSKKRIKVKKFTKDGCLICTYQNMVMAAKDLQVKNIETAANAIGKCCRGKTKTAYNYKWGFDYGN